MRAWSSTRGNQSPSLGMSAIAASQKAASIHLIVAAAADGVHEPFAVQDERERLALGDEPRIGRLDEGCRHVAVLEGLERTLVPAVDAVDTHRLRLCAPGLLRHPLPQWADPASVCAELFRDAENLVWLDSGVHATEGRSYLASGARTVSSSDFAAAASVLQFLESDLAGRRIESVTGFSLGWVGWLGYELRAETMDVPRSRTSRYPDAAFVFVDRAIEFDHTTGAVTLLALGTAWTGELAAWRDEVTAVYRDAPETLPARPARHTSATWRYSDDEYLELIRRCKAAIAEGDAYQLCLTTEATVAAPADPFATWLALRESSPSHHGAFLRIGGVSLLSSSPEQFLSVSPDGIDRIQADQGNASARRDCRCGCRAPRRAAREREGTRREPHDRRPHAQRHRSR